CRLDGDARLAGRPCRAEPSLGRVLVRPDGKRHAWPARPDYIDLGGEVRSCRSGDQLCGRTLVAAVGDLLFDRRAVADLSPRQPRQPLFLCHLGLSLWLSRSGRFAGGVRCPAVAGDQCRPRRALLLAPSQRLENQVLISGFVHTTCDNYERILSTPFSLATPGRR